MIMCINIRVCTGCHCPHWFSKNRLGGKVMTLNLFFFSYLLDMCFKFMKNIVSSIQKQLSPEFWCQTPNPRHRQRQSRDVINASSYKLQDCCRLILGREVSPRGDISLQLRFQCKVAPLTAYGSSLTIQSTVCFRALSLAAKQHLNAWSGLGSLDCK